MIIVQLEQAKELLNNNDATLNGVLLALCAILLFAVWHLWKKNNDLQDKRVADSEEFRKVAMELTERTLTAINQMADITNKLNN